MPKTSKLNKEYGINEAEQKGSKWSLRYNHRKQPGNGWENEHEWPFSKNAGATTIKSIK